METLPLPAGWVRLSNILGTNLKGANKVSFYGTEATFTVVSATEIKTNVSYRATTGFVSERLREGTLKSNKKVRVIPQITGSSPTSGPPDTSVTINGESFTGATGATSVTLGGVPATFMVNSYTKITATIATAVKTGKITVTTPGGTLELPGVASLWTPTISSNGSLSTEQSCRWHCSTHNDCLGSECESSFK